MRRLDNPKTKLDCSHNAPTNSYTGHKSPRFQSVGAARERILVPQPASNRCLTNKNRFRGDRTERDSVLHVLQPVPL